MSKENQFPLLGSPIKIGPIEVKNRFFVAPMNETMSGVQGTVTEESRAYYAARAYGGYGLIVTGAIIATKMAARFVWGRNHSLYSMTHVQGLQQLTEAIHYHGGKVSAQLSMGFGRQGHSDDHDELAPAATANLPYEMCLDKLANNWDKRALSSNTVRAGLVGQNTREMSIDEIHSEQKEYCRNLQRAGIAGFDMIEIHAPHGYLEHQFLSAHSNKRTDMYGGSWRNRKRFLLETVEQARYACGYGMALGVRISGEEHFEGGITREEMIDLAQDMEKIGIDYLSLSDGGGYEEVGHLIIDADRWEHWPQMAKDFKDALKIPVMMAGAHDPKVAEKCLADGCCDMIGHGRQSVIEPHSPNLILAGKLDELKICKRCNTCLLRALAGAGMRCPFNPNLGREWAMDEYNTGPMQKHENLMPPALTAGMPVIDLPWWKKELPVCEKFPIPFRGPGPR